MSKIAIIRLRGGIGKPDQIKDTLRLLHLNNTNGCVVQENTPALQGMIHKVKDMVTYGEIDDETYTSLVEKRGEKATSKETSKSKKEPATEKIKPCFRLNNPRGGFERKGIKRGFKAGGALGYRGKKINDLIKKMI